MAPRFSSFVSTIFGLPRTVSSQSENYCAEDFARIAGGRECPVVVRGNPFADRGWDDGAFAASVVAAMQRRNLGPETRFVLHRMDETISAHRVVLSFNGDAATTAAALCAIPQEHRGEPHERSGHLRVLAVWCRDGTVLSECSGRVAGVGSPADRRFARLIAQVTRELFPMLIGPGGLKGH
jgi:hypothetical protein